MVIRRLFYALFFVALMALPACAQQKVTLTGTVEAKTDAYIKVRLQNCGTALPRVIYDGVFQTVLVQTQYTVYPNTSGQWSVDVWPNNLIVCNGTSGNTVYSVQYVQSNGDVGIPQDYQVSSTSTSFDTTTHTPINILPPANAPGSDFDFNSLNLGSYIKAPTGTFNTISAKNLDINGITWSGLQTSAGEILTGTDGDGSRLYNSNGTLVGIRGAVNAALPMFGLGTPVNSVSVTGSCTSNPTVTISAPQESADGSQATADAYCVNGAVKTFVNFRGGGYTSATCTVSGGGTSSPTCSVSLLGTAAPADPTDANDSTAAIQNALDYAYKKSIASSITASVRIPQGEFDLNSRLLVPCDVTLSGEGQTATVLDVTDTSEDGLIVLDEQNHPNGWDCRGSLSNLEVYASQGHKYTATLIALDGISGYRMQNIDVSGGGGRGINTVLGTERTFAQNIEIDTVRWPLIWMGNEQHMIKLNIASPGESLGNYCMDSSNCVNGHYPSTNWAGGTLEYATADGTTATFYVHSASSSYPDSPIVAGQHFTVVGTTGTSLDGLYKATSVTNSVTSDPSGKCSPSNVCFEVQAASTVNGTATLTAPTTTATCSSGSYTITVASASGFYPWEFVTGPGIPSNTRVQKVNGTTLTLSNKTTSAETSVTITGKTAWYPTIMPDYNAAVTFGSAAGQIMDGSIKSDPYAGCFNTPGTFSSSISHFYCEGYPLNGSPIANSVLHYGGYNPVATFTSSLAGSDGGGSEVGVSSTAWMTWYVNDPAMMYGHFSAYNGAEYKIVPQDFTYGSTAASAYVSGVEKGQYEIVWGVFTAADKFIITGRDAKGSTAPSGTTWPAGSKISFYAPSDSGYGPLTVADMHSNIVNGPSSNWAVGCNDQSTKGNVCGTYLIGSEPNEISTFTTGQAGGGAGTGGANVSLINDENWAGAGELMGQGFVKTVGRGGTVVETGTEAPSNLGYGIEATNGQLLKDYYVNVPGFDGSYPYASFTDLNNGLYYSNGIGAKGTNGGSLLPIRAGSGQAPLTGSPGSDAALGMQFQNSYCWWDMSSNANSHAPDRFCFLGSPNHSPGLQAAKWNGSSWVTSWTIPFSATPVFAENTNTFTNNNTFELTTTFKNSGKSYWEFDSNGNLWEYSASGNELIRADDVGNLGLSSGSLLAPYIRITDNSDSGVDDAYFESNTAGEVFLDKGTSNNEAGDGTLTLGTLNAKGVSTGSQTVYRCTAAGALPIGALTTDSSQCGGTAPTYLTVH